MPSCASLRFMTTESISSVKQGRLLRGMTQRDLAEMCAQEGVPVEECQISRIERGVNMPRPRLRALLARLLDLDYFADFQAEPPARRSPGAAA